MTTSFKNDQGTGTVEADGFTGPSAGAASFPDGITVTGYLNQVPQVVAAAGASQGTATLISTGKVRVTVTASTEGVRLPSAATGAQVMISVPGAVGVKVYPFLHDKIDAGASNVAQALAAGKTNIYNAYDTTHWTVMKGA